MKLFFLFIIIYFFVAKNLSAQEISGTVSDSIRHIFLKDVNIFIPGLKKGTVSDENGEFLIDVTGLSNITLVISHIGYKTIKIPVSLTTGKSLKFYIKLSLETKNISQVIVSATRTNRGLKDIPASVTLITKNDIKELPVDATDDILKYNSAMVIDRKNGIFSKNSSVTMRGLNSTARTLIMLDGVPLNKADGGGVNWNRINMESIDRIEVVKGPGSALYGGNAMAGVVNVITGEPSDTLAGSFRVSYGSCNTVGSRLWIGNSFPFSKKLYWNINTFYRQGDGYLIRPENLRDSTDVKTYLKEYNIGGRIGYAINDSNRVEGGYDLYDDKRGDGIRVYDPEGGYNRYKTNHAYLRYSGNIGDFKIDANSYFQLENYLNQKEQLKTDKLPPFPVTQYVLYLVNSHRNDYGIWLATTKNIFQNHKFTAGVDYKMGTVNASDFYFTSTDTVTTTGALSSYAIFFQDEFNFFNDHLKFIVGIRSDAISFHDASFNIAAPSAQSSLIAQYDQIYSDTLWLALSPKFAVQYSFINNTKLFFNYGHGFRPGTLDDMCRNGNITKGIKLANPHLNPESIDNFEIGSTFNIKETITVEPAVYYSLGNNFHYFVGTGDTVFETTKPKPILKRENISQVEIMGAELNIAYKPLENLVFSASYAYNHSVIKKFDTRRFVSKNLTAKYIMEVPDQRFSVSGLLRTIYCNFMLAYSYTGRMFADDENTIKNPDSFTVDFKLSKIVSDKFFVSMGIQNLTNETYIDAKGNLGMSRFYMFEAGYKF